MIVATEGFDNLHPSYYWSIPGFYYQGKFDFSALSVPGRSGVPFLSDYDYEDRLKFPILQDHRLSSGRCLLLSPGGDWDIRSDNAACAFVRPFLFRKSRKVTVGFSFGFQVQRYDRPWTGNRSFSNANGLGISNWTDKIICFDINFIGTPNLVDLSKNSAGYNNKHPSLDTILFRCRVYFTNEHSICIRFFPDNPYTLDHNAYTGLYPLYPSSGNIPCDLTDAFNYFEVSVDSDGATNSQGRAEFRLNGKTVFALDDIITSAYLKYGSDAFSLASYFQSISFASIGEHGDYYPNILIDDIYVTNEEGGVNTGFLGPVKISPQTASVLSVDQFDERDGSVLIADPNTDEFVRVFLEKNPTKRLESFISGSVDEFLISADLDDYSVIHGISHRLALIGNPVIPAGNGSALISPTIRFTGSDISVAPVFVPCFPGVFAFRDYIYNYNPNTFTRFTPADVSSALFGFKHSSSSSVFDAIAGSLPSLVTTDGGGAATLSSAQNLTDNDPLTYTAINQKLVYYDVPSCDDILFVTILLATPTWDQFNCALIGPEGSTPLTSYSDERTPGFLLRTFSVPFCPVTTRVRFSGYYYSSYTINVYSFKVFRAVRS